MSQILDNFIVRLFYPRYYATVQYLLTCDRSSRSYRLWNVTYICHCLFLSARFALYGIAILLSWDTYQKCDPVIAEFDPHRVFDWYCYELAAIFTVFGVVAHYYCYMQENAIIALFYRFLIGTRRHFFRLNPGFLLQFKYIKQLDLEGCIREAKRIWSLLKDPKGVQFMWTDPHEPQFQETGTRLRVLALMILFDLGHVIIHVIAAGLLPIMLGFFLLRSIQRGYPLWVMATIQLDILGIWYIGLSGISAGFYFSYNVQLSAVVIQRHMQNLNRELQKLRTKWSVAALTTGLLLFHAKHWRTLRNVDYTNRTLGSPMSSSLFITNIGINVYLITRLFLISKIQILHMQLISGTVVLAQGVGLFVGLWPPIMITKALYSAEPYLHPLIIRFIPFVAFKLKFAFLYEQLRTKQQLTFTVGTLGKVTQKTVFEFIFIYAVYIMYMVGLIRKNGIS